MRRHKTSGKAVRTRGPKTSIRRDGQAARHSSSSAASDEAEIARLTRELNGALERQTATSEVLRIISSSPGDLEPVFKSMLANAMRICEAQCGFIFRMEAGVMRAMAEIGVPPAFAEYRRNHLHAGGAATLVDVMRATKKPVHVHDARKSDA